MQVKLKKSKSCTQTAEIRYDYAKARGMQGQIQYAVRNRFNILCIEETEQYQKVLENSKEQIDRKWKDFRDCLQTAANEVLLMRSKWNKERSTKRIITLNIIN